MPTSHPLLVALARTFIAELRRTLPSTDIPDEATAIQLIEDMGTLSHYLHLMVELSHLAPTPETAKWLRDLACVPTTPPDH